MGLLIVIVQLLSHVQFFCSRLLCPWDFPDKNTGVDWSGFPFASPGDLLNPGVKPTSPALAEVFFAIKPRGIATVCTEELMLLNCGVEEDS